MNKKVFLYVLILILTLVIVGVVVISTYPPKSDQVEPEQDNAQATYITVDENYSVPENMLLGMSVENKDVEEVYTITYPDSGAEEYSLSYTSSVSLEELYTSYKEQMVAEGFTLSTDEKHDTLFYLYGVGDEENLSVTVSEQESGRLVQLSRVVSQESKDSSDEL